MVEFYLPTIYDNFKKAFYEEDINALKELAKEVKYDTIRTAPREIRGDMASCLLEKEGLKALEKKWKKNKKIKKIQQELMGLRII